MYDKRKFHKINDKKVLHKVKKQWVTVSLALLMMLGGGVVAAHVTASANAVNNSVSTPTSTVTEQANQLHATLVQHADQQNQMRLGAHRDATYVHSHFRRTNSRRQLKQSSFYNKYERVPKGISRHVIYNKYAPNDHRAAIPRRFKLLNNMAWVKSTPWYALSHPGVTDLYLYHRRNNTWLYSPGSHKYGRRVRKVRKARKPRITRRVRRNRRRHNIYAKAGKTPAGGPGDVRSQRKSRRTRRVKITRRKNHPYRVIHRRSYHRKGQFRQHRNVQVTTPQYQPVQQYQQPSKPVVQPTQPSYAGYYVSSDGNGSDMFMTNSNLADMNNQNKASDSDFSDDYVNENEDEPLKAQIVNSTTLAGYPLDQINHQVSDHPGNVWVFPQELSHSRDSSFDANGTFDMMIRKIIQNHKDYQKQLSVDAFQKSFTPSEQVRVNELKQEYRNLKQNEDGSDDIYATKPDLAHGVVGSLTDSFKDHMIDWINFYRGMYGLSPVTDNPDYDVKAQYGADGCNALGNIVHGLNGMSGKPANISSDAWQKGIDATNSSNLSGGGANNPSYIEGYFDDGDNALNTSSGHRAWILDQGLNQVGIGVNNGFGDLYIITPSDTSENMNRKTLVFPHSGVFPLSDAQNGPWTMYVPENDSLSDVNVTVHDDTTNTNVSVSGTAVYSGYGWYNEVDSHVNPDQLFANHQYTITITGNGVPNGTLRYTTKLFKLSDN